MLLSIEILPTSIKALSLSLKESLLEAVSYYDITLLAWALLSLLVGKGDSGWWEGLLHVEGERTYVPLTCVGRGVRPRGKAGLLAYSWPRD